jgi:olefin beta-lactone synthetase
VNRAGRTYPVLCYEVGGKLPREDVQRKLQAKAKQLEHTRRIDTFLMYGFSFPVDVRHNSKIFREKLADWADNALGKHWRPTDNVLS